MGELEISDCLTDLKRWIGLFIEEKRNRALSKHTLRNYMKVLDDFHEYFVENQDNIRLSTLNKAHIAAFLEFKAQNGEKQALNGRIGISNATKSLYLTVIKIFLRFISDNNTDGVDLTRCLQKMSVKKPQKVRKGLSADEIERIERFIAVERRKKRSFLRSRNILITAIALYAGLRCAEIIALKISDIELIEDEAVYKIEVFGKGSKERYSYAPECKLAKELEVLRSMGCERVAITKEGKPMSPSEVWRVISGVLHRAGIDKTGVHILRHTFALRLVSRDITLTTIQELMGHSNIQTTQIYAKSNEKAKAKAIAKTA